MPRLLHWLFARSARPRRRRHPQGSASAAWLPHYAEVLEERTLLSATLDGSGLLTIPGTGQDDAIRESAVPDAGDGHVSLAGPSSAQPPAGNEPFSILPYPGFLGGVRVAAGDVNDDGTPDIIVAAGPGGGPHVKVFDGATGSELRSVFAFDPGFTGGVRVAAGDVNGDTFIDIITSPGPGGGPHVRVLDGLSGDQVRSFFAFDPSFSGGVFVAEGDVGSDNELELSIFGGDALEELFALLDGGTRLDTGRADINDVYVSQSPDARDNTVFIMTVNPWVGSG